MDNEFVFDALGTRWWIALDGAWDPALREAIAQEVARFEAAYSRFRDDSLLSILNDKKELSHAPAELIELLEFGVNTYRETGHVFNMSVGASLEQAGYGRAPDASARLSNSLAKDIEISGDTVRIAPHVRLDFGGFGKGWLIDKLGTMLREAGQRTFIINGGGDILVGDSSEELHIEHPTDLSLAIGTVHVRAASLASSSPRKRSWRASDGTMQTHIRPTTADIADDLASVHILAGDATTADMLGTTFLLVSRAKRVKLANQYDAHFLEISTDGRYWRTPGFPFEPFTA